MGACLLPTGLLEAEPIVSRQVLLPRASDPLGFWHRWKSGGWSLVGLSEACTAVSTLEIKGLDPFAEGRCALALVMGQESSEEPVRTGLVRGGKILLINKHLLVTSDHTL